MVCVVASQYPLKAQPGMPRRVVDGGCGRPQLRARVDMDGPAAVLSSSRNEEARMVALSTGKQASTHQRRRKREEEEEREWLREKRELERKGKERRQPVC